MTSAMKTTAMMRTIEATSPSTPTATPVPTTHWGGGRNIIHPVWVRLTHWVNVLAMLMMITSGWQIYDASPLFPFTFPPAITLGGWLAGALLWHFAAMWLLMINGLVYVTLGIMTGRFRRKLLPLWPGQVIADARAAFSGRLSHEDLSVYNAVQKLLYLGVIICAVVIVLS